MTYTADEAIVFLRDQISKVKDVRLQCMCRDVLLDNKFRRSPGGSEHHHDFPCGLVIHVAEVMYHCSQITELNDILITAVMYHDYMKIRDYSLEKNPEGGHI